MTNVKTYPSVMILQVNPQFLFGPFLCLLRRASSFIRPPETSLQVGLFLDHLRDGDFSSARRLRESIIELINLDLFVCQLCRTLLMKV
jgi:hypothetical protein